MCVLRSGALIREERGQWSGGPLMKQLSLRTRPFRPEGASHPVVLRYVVTYKGVVAWVHPEPAISRVRALSRRLSDLIRGWRLGMNSSQIFSWLAALPRGWPVLFTFVSF